MYVQAWACGMIKWKTFFNLKPYSVKVNHKKLSTNVKTHNLFTLVNRSEQCTTIWPWSMLCCHQSTMFPMRSSRDYGLKALFTHGIFFERSENDADNIANIRNRVVLSMYILSFQRLPGISTVNHWRSSLKRWCTLYVIVPYVHQCSSCKITVIVP